MGVVLQAHPVVHGGADLGEGIVPGAGVDLRGDIRGKVPQAAAGEQSPQVHRQQHLHRLAAAAPGHLLRLQVGDGLHHGGAQQLRHGYAILPGTGADPVHRHHHGHQVLIPVLFRGAAEVIGGALRPAGGNVPGIAQEAVLQLLRTGLLQAAQHTLFRRDADAVFLAQILRRQGFQEDQPPGAVGDGVEKLHCHPVVIHQHPEGAAPHLAEGHMGQALRKKQPHFVFHWRGGGLNREILTDLLNRCAAAAAERGKCVSCSVNTAQAVVQLDFTDAPAGETLLVQQPDEGNEL